MAFRRSKAFSQLLVKEPLSRLWSLIKRTSALSIRSDLRQIKIDPKITGITIGSKIFLDVRFIVEED